MIRGFRHKGLRELEATGGTGKIDRRLHARIVRRLDALKAATRPEDMDIPGFDFHSLKGKSRYTVHVNGPWCITFGFEAGDATDVDLEQYH